MIHKFSMNGYNMVLDVDGGSVHILDDVAYELVDLYEENTKEEIIAKLEDKFTAEQIDEAYDEITSLKEEGLLFTTDTYEFNPNFVNRQKVVKALCLHVSHDCNLRCKYCFASQGDFGYVLHPPHKVLQNSKYPRRKPQLPLRYWNLSTRTQGSWSEILCLCWYPSRGLTGRSGVHIRSQ